MTSTLYQHQLEFLKENPAKKALVWSCGTGKTRTAIEWATLGREHALIICPKALKTNWAREVSRWANPKNFTIMSKEEFRRDYFELPAVKQIIIDEIHNGFLTPHFKSQMSKALKKYISRHEVPRVLALSATVYTSSPWNIYNLAVYTGKLWNYRDFDHAFFDQIRMGPRVVPVAKKGIEKELAEITKRIASVVDINDVIDVPLQNHLEPEYFALSKEQKKAIKDNYDPLPIVRSTYKHEIENGVLLGNEFRELQIFKYDKEDRIVELCRENTKVAVVCRYNDQIDILFTRLRQEFSGRKLFVINGKNKDRDGTTILAEQLNDCIVIIQNDCSEGYNLPSFEFVIFASQSYKFKDWEQVCGRFLRQDKPSRTTFIYLLAEGDSIDQAVYDAIKRKEDFQINLYEK